MKNSFQCTQRGTVGLEPGFVEDAGQNFQGFARWIQGALERGPFGGAKRMGKPAWQIDTFRCPNCAHLELFAGTRV